MNFKKMAVIALTLATIISGTTSMAASDRDICEFKNFYVHYQTTDVGEKYTRECTKKVTNRDAVVNLKSDSGSAWISCIMRNSNNEARGSVALQRGERKTFQSTGKENHLYRLGMRKTYNTGGGYVYINGSWCPDAY